MSQQYPPTKPFTPMYIFPAEYSSFGLPTSEVQNDIDTIVQMASLMVDEACGAVDGDGNGSLVYSTYVQRNLLQTRNRNLVYLASKPIVGLDNGDITALSGFAASGYGGIAASGVNCFYTGFQANTITAFGGNQLSGIVGASGRYGYSRQDMSIAYPDLFAFINPLNLVTMFGGPAPWVAIDISNTDYDAKTGEVWIPAGLQLQKYSEVLFVYNAGFNPLVMPLGVKQVTASIVKRLLASDATTGLMTMSMGRSGMNVQFAQSIIDPTLDAMLQPFKRVRAY